MRFQAACTLEGWTTRPRTTRTVIDAASAAKALSRALKAARQEHPGARWRSLVVVLEKLDEADVEDAAVEPQAVGD